MTRWKKLRRDFIKWGFSVYKDDAWNSYGRPRLYGKGIDLSVAWVHNGYNPEYSPYAHYTFEEFIRQHYGRGFQRGKSGRTVPLWADIRLRRDPTVVRFWSTNNTSVWIETDDGECREVAYSQLRACADRNHRWGR